MKNKRSSYSELFLVLSVIFVVCLLLSNILASKLIKIGSYSITAGVLVFPISYIINDILSEVYGYEDAKKIIYLGFILNLFMVLIFSLAIVLPAPAFYENGEAFKTILGSTPRNCLASLLAYLFGSIINAKIIVKMKQKNKNFFGVRAIVSTIFGELTDSLIFVLIAFIGKLDITQIMIMIFLQVFIKTLYEVICLPVTARLIVKIKEYEMIK